MVDSLSGSNRKDVSRFRAKGLIPCWKVVCWLSAFSASISNYNQATTFLEDAHMIIDELLHLFVNCSAPLLQLSVLGFLLFVAPRDLTYIELQQLVHALRLC